MIFDIKCEDCARRRELMTLWARGWADWARDPLRNPRPGTKEWLEKVSQIQEAADTKNIS